MNKNRLVLLASTLVIAFLISACGGSSEPPTPASQLNLATLGALTKPTPAPQVNPTLLSYFATQAAGPTPTPNFNQAQIIDGRLAWDLEVRIRASDGSWGTARVPLAVYGNFVKVVDLKTFRTWDYMHPTRDFGTKLDILSNNSFELIDEYGNVYSSNDMLGTRPYRYMLSLQNPTSGATWRVRTTFPGGSFHVSYIPVFANYNNLHNHVYYLVLEPR